MRDEDIHASRIQILLPTCNSGSFLGEQLNSIEQQNWPRIDVLASDDLSTDGTIERLHLWQRRWRKGRFEILAGPAAGFAENYRRLVLAASDEVDYVSFCDHDDIWACDKVKTSIDALAVDRTYPGLFCSPTTLIDAVGRVIGASPRFRKQPSFQNALVQNIASGNTMTFNRAGFAVLREAASRTSFPFHDWFAYQILTGAGGRILYGADPKVWYRQHRDNAFGISLGVGSWVRRIRRLTSGRMGEATDANIAALMACIDLLTPDARHTLARFAESRSGSVVARLRRLRLSGVYRQSSLDQVLLYLTSITWRT